MNFGVIELMTVYFGTNGWKRMDPTFRVPAVGLFLMLSKMGKSVFRFICRWSIDLQRLEPSTSPATHPDLTKVTYVVGV